MTTKAYELREKVSEAERYYIEARYYTTVQTDMQKALDVYKVWLATYPGDYTALTNSALLHKQQGDRAEAIRKLELATKVAPDQPLAFTNLGQTYFEAGQYADARKAYENAILLQDSTGARVGLYQIAILTGDTALADQQVAAVAGRRDEVDMVAIRMFAATYRGRMKEASDLAADFQARALALSRPQAAGNGIMQLAISEALVGLIDQAKARVDKAEEDGILAENTVDDRMVVAAIAEGRRRCARAAGRRRSSSRRRVGDDRPPALGGRARDHGARGAGGRQAGGGGRAASSRCRSSLAHRRRQHLDDRESAGPATGAAAVKGLTFMNSREARAGLSATTAYVYATLARVQVKMGQKDEARKSYQKFLELFKDADPDLPLLDRSQGRNREARLLRSCRLMEMASGSSSLSIFVFVSASAWAQQAAIEYKLSFPAPEHRWMQVEVRFPNVPGGTLQLRMARTSPGRYALHEFAKNVFDVSIVNGKGQPLTATRPDPHQWDVANHDGTVVVTYKVFGDRTDGTYLGIDDIHAHINIPAALMFARGWFERPARVTFVQPPGKAWKVATQLFPTERSARLHRAEHPLPDGQPHRLQQLHAADVHGGRWAEAEWPAADVPHRADARRHRGGSRRVREGRRAHRPRGDSDLRRAAEFRDQHLYVPERLPAVGQRRRHGASQQHVADQLRARCAIRSSARAFSARWRTSSSTPGTWSACARPASSRSTSKKPT